MFGFANSRNKVEADVKILRTHSPTPGDVLRLFSSAVNGEAIELTNENIEGFSALCREFQFGSLSRRLDSFKNTPTSSDSGWLEPSIQGTLADNMSNDSESRAACW
jgi:hypothetical protein